MTAWRRSLLGAVVLLTACEATRAGTVMPPTPPVTAAAAATTPAVASPAVKQPPRGGMALGPSLTMIQGVVPGGPAETGLAYHLENRGTSPLTLSLAVQPPQHAGTPTWELGYEPVPDPAWFTITPSVVELAGGESRDATLTWTLPAGAEFLNRRFAVCVVMRPGDKAAVGAGLALAARVQFETASDPSADAGAMAALATIPSAVTVDLAPGAATDCTVLVRRTGATGAGEMAWTGLDQAESEAERRPRYATPGTIPAAIVTPPQGSLPSHGSDWVPLKLHVQAPADAMPGTQLEQILVVGTPDQLAIASRNPRKAQPLVALIRCQVRVTAKASP